MSKIMYGGIAYGSAVDKDYGWTDLTGTLVAGETTLTIQHEIITPDVTIAPHSDPFGISPKDMVVTNGQVVLTFNAQPNDVGIMVRVSKTNKPPEKLFDPNTYLVDKFIRPGTGEEAASGGWRATPFISVIPGEVLTCATMGLASYNYSSWYDENQTFIVSFNTSNNGYSLLTVPNDAYYMRCSSQVQNMESSMIWRGL